MFLDGLIVKAVFEDRKAIVDADGAAASCCFLLFPFLHERRRVCGVWSGLVARGISEGRRGKLARRPKDDDQVDGERGEDQWAEWQQATDGEGQTTIISHNARWQIGGPQANPCHQQLNNSSCISASQGMESRGEVIGPARGERCQPLLVEGW